MQHLLWRLRQSQYRRSLYTEYAVCVGHQLPGGTTIPVSKKKKMWHAIPAPTTACTVFAAESKTIVDNYAHEKTSAMRHQEKTNKYENEARAPHS